MAAKASDLYSKITTKREEESSMDKQLSKLEEDIRKLKIDFDIYFNGATKRPPLETRARLEAQIKRIMDNRSLTYAQRYHMNALISRFTSYRELWRRGMRARGEEMI
jgi:hypothetical protein